MGKPKIAILVPRYGLVNRGVEIFAQEFLNHLKTDFELTIYSRVKTTKETQRVFAIAESTKLLEWTYKLNPWLKEKLDRYFLNPIGVEMLTFSIFVFPRLFFGDYDLLFPQNGVWGAIVCRLVRFLKRTPFIYLSAGGKEPPIVRQKPDLYIALNPETRDWIRGYRPEVKTVLIPYGVDLKKFSPQTKALKITLERPIYLCVAALIPAKGIELAIKATAKLRKGSLLITGDGSLKEGLTELGQRLLGKGRFLIIKAPYEKMPSIYTTCDVFTLSSKDEPFGIVYLEALASGLPVVTPDDKSRRYIVGPAGILCDTENLEKYSQALKEVVELNFGDKPRKQAEKFSWKKIAGKYKEEIKKLLL